MALGGAMSFAPALLAQDASTNAPAGRALTPAAQGGAPRGQNADQMVQRLTTRLNLTADEQAKVKPIIEDEMQQMAALRSMAPEDRRAKMMALREETMSNMQAVLTPDQFTQYQQMAPRGRRPGMGPGGNTNAPAGGPPTGTPPPPPPQQ